MISYYAQYALAAYGWPLFVYARTCGGSCQLLCGRFGCCRCGGACGLAKAFAVRGCCCCCCSCAQTRASSPPAPPARPPVYPKIEMVGTDTFRLHSRAVRYALGVQRSARRPRARTASPSRVPWVDSLRAAVAERGARARHRAPPTAAAPRAVPCSYAAVAAVDVSATSAHSPRTSRRTGRTLSSSSSLSASSASVSGPSSGASREALPAASGARPARGRARAASYSHPSPIPATQGSPATVLLAGPAGTARHGNGGLPKRRCRGHQQQHPHHRVPSDDGTAAVAATAPPAAQRDTADCGHPRDPSAHPALDGSSVPRGAYVIRHSLTNGLHRSVYLVCCDDVAEVVVVAVRGTLSISDAATDIDAVPTPVVAGRAAVQATPAGRRGAQTARGTPGGGGWGRSGGWVGDAGDDDGAADAAVQEAQCIIGLVPPCGATAPRSGGGRDAGTAALGGSAAAACVHALASAGAPPPTTTNTRAAPHTHHRGPPPPVGYVVPTGSDGADGSPTAAGDTTVEYVHTGFLHGAVWLLGDVWPTLCRLYAPRAPTRRYRLVVLGHSLGAGIAAIVAAVLRGGCHQRLAALVAAVAGGAAADSAAATAAATGAPTTAPTTVPPSDAQQLAPPPPRLLAACRAVEAVAFSPPGQTFSRHLAAGVSPYIVSIVIREEAVPRFSVRTLLDAKSRAVAALAACTSPKYLAARTTAISSATSVAVAPRAAWWDEISKHVHLPTFDAVRHRVLIAMTDASSAANADRYVAQLKARLAQSKSRRGSAAVVAAGKGGGVRSVLQSGTLAALGGGPLVPLGSAPSATSAASAVAVSTHTAPVGVSLTGVSVASMHRPAAPGGTRATGARAGHGGGPSGALAGSGGHAFAALSAQSSTVATARTPTSTPRASALLERFESDATVAAACVALSPDDDDVTASGLGAISTPAAQSLYIAALELSAAARAAASDVAGTSAVRTPASSLHRKRSPIGFLASLPSLHDIPYIADAAAPRAHDTRSPPSSPPAAAVPQAGSAARTASPSSLPRTSQAAGRDSGRLPAPLAGGAGSVGTASGPGTSAITGTSAGTSANAAAGSSPASGGGGRGGGGGGGRTPPPVSLHETARGILSPSVSSLLTDDVAVRPPQPPAMAPPGHPSAQPILVPPLGAPPLAPLAPQTLAASPPAGPPPAAAQAGTSPPMSAAPWAASGLPSGRRRGSAAGTPVGGEQERVAHAAVRLGAPGSAMAAAEARAAQHGRGGSLEGAGDAENSRTLAPAAAAAAAAVAVTTSTSHAKPLFAPGAIVVVLPLHGWDADARDGAARAHAWRADFPTVPLSTLLTQCGCRLPSGGGRRDGDHALGGRGHWPVGGSDPTTGACACGTDAVTIAADGSVQPAARVVLLRAARSWLATLSASPLHMLSDHFPDFGLRILGAAVETRTGA